MAAMLSVAISKAHYTVCNAEQNEGLCESKFSTFKAVLLAWRKIWFR